jgi:hypothetical protein
MSKIILILLLFFSSSYATSSEEIIKLFQNGWYEECIKKAKACLTQMVTLPQEKRILVHYYLGLAYALTNSLGEAEAEFRTVLKILLFAKPKLSDKLLKELKIDSQLDLVPGWYPEVVYSRWQKAKRSLEKVHIIKVPQREEILLRQRISFKNIALSFLPGGVVQFKYRQQKKALLLLSLEALFLGASVGGYILWKRERDEFGKYKNLARAQNYKKLQDIGFSLFLITYLYNIIDGIINYGRVK